jgi:coenzyme F420-reducing hydrogenase beta subunit
MDNSKLLNLPQKNCTGCSACFACCPTNSIEMRRDAEGFERPYINAYTCIHCMNCIRVCPAINPKKNITNNCRKAYAAITNNQATWLSSTSGGAFTEVCYAVSELFSEKQIIYAGATLDNFQVIHQCVSQIDEINRFQKSKYIQSSMGNVYGQIREALSNNSNFVVFSGTPCQIAGLKAYLGKERNNLLTIDLICHGVGSQTVFDAYLKDFQKQKNKKLTNYTFRAKDVKYGSFERHTSKYDYSDGSSEFKKFDGYNRLFLNQSCIRPSCNQCSYRSTKRHSDITLADFNGKFKLLPEVNNYRNFSTILFNTTKSLSLLPVLRKKMTLYECSVQDIERNNPLLSRPAKPNPQRDLFFKDFLSGSSFDSLVERYGIAPPTGLQTLILKLPYRLKRLGGLFLRKIRRIFML